MTRQEEIQLKNELMETKEKLKISKKKVYDLSQELNSYKSEVKSLNKDNESKISKSDYDALIIERDRLLARNIHLERNAKDQKQLQNKIRSLNFKISSLKKDVDDRNNKIYLNNITFREREKELSEGIDYLVKHTKGFYDNVKWNIADAINYLNKNLNHSTLDLYTPILSISQMIECMVDARNEKLNNITDEDKYGRKDVMFGIITNELRVIDFDGNSYDINGSPYSDLTEYIEYPCKCVMSDDGTVSLTYIYRDSSERRSNNRYVIFKKQMEKSEKKPQYDKPLNVLVVGTNYKELYTRTINDYGLNCIWFDPFKNSTRRLESVYKSADICILLKDHMKHYVVDVIDPTLDNVALIGNDSVRSIVSMINYLIMKNDLARICS